MLVSEPGQLSQLLTLTAAALDIPIHAYEAAVIKYEEVGAWLTAADSSLAEHSPQIYPQGSFRLGTVIQPTGPYDYDVDLVCVLKIVKERITQKDLKRKIGDRLRQDPSLREMLSPGCRCWLLDYPKQTNVPSFHMDVLPSIYNVDQGPSGILLTDTELVRWQRSNPIAYCDWFYEKMKPASLRARAELAKASGANIKDVPDWQFKTPLQLAVQVLKRHRDIFFRSHLIKPTTSIILTTLAARAYRDQADVYEAVNEIVREMPKFIERRNNLWWIENPVEPGENFADRWNQDPSRYQNFVKWLDRARTDFVHLSRVSTLENAVEHLREPMGSAVMARVASDLGLDKGLRSMPSATPRLLPLADTHHCQGLAWPETLHYSAKPTATAYFGKQGKKLWPVGARALHKKLWIQFRLETDAPFPYDVKWQVVNTGREALEAAQLRGGFYDAEVGGSIRWERIGYSGTHWAEGFVIKGSRCVARTGRIYVKVF